MEATRERMKIARQQMLGDIIRHMNWVQDAVVLYDEQQPRGIRRDKIITASVSVTPVLGESLDPRRMRELQKLVAHSVAGMGVEDVVVTGMGGDSNFLAGGVFPESFDSEYYQTRVAYEQYKKSSILNQLSYIPGVRVEVSAELDDTVQETVQNLKPDKSGTALKTLTVEETTSSGTLDGGGQPGLTAQGPNRQGVLPQLAQREIEQDFQNNRRGRQHRRPGTARDAADRIHAQGRLGHGLHPPLLRRNDLEAAQPRRHRCPETRRSDQHPNRADHPSRRNRDAAAHASKPRPGRIQTRQSRDRRFDSMPSIVPPTLAANAMAWTGRYWTSLAMVGVAMFSLMVIKSVVKGSPAGGSPLAVSPALSVHADETGGGGGGESSDPDAPPRNRLRIKKGVSLKDDLAEMVREDPEAAAAILKSWIGKAA